MSEPTNTTTVERTEPLAGLNLAQREAVLHFEGPMLVLAGAGSGKTRVLTTRIARLIEHHGVDPSRILSVTFTNKAAGEMRERIGRLLGEEPKGMWSGTFHAIGARILRSSAHHVGRTSSFTIYDEDDSLGVIKRIMEQQGVPQKQYSPKVISSLISDAKNSLVSPDEYESLAMDPVSRTAAKIYRQLEPTLRAGNAVSFDDLLVLPVEIFRKDETTLARYRDRFQFILVDEYQDTNRAQFQFIKLLGSKHGNVVVVGDDDQSIYGWRGADIRNILDFEKEFASSKIVRLEDNYRSTPDILHVANAAITQNIGRKGKTLRATREAGERVTLLAALDERDEADFILEEIKARRHRENRGFNEFAVLYRTNAQSRAIEDALRREAIPYRLVGSVRFYDRREIRDVMAYLKLIANPSDEEAFRRAIAVPKRGIGDSSVDTLSARAKATGVSLSEVASREDLQESLRPAARKALAEFTRLLSDLRERAKDTSVDVLIQELIGEIRYVEYLQAEGPESARDRIENLSALVNGAAETVIDDGGEVGLTPLDHFLQRAMLVAGADALDPSADAVTLMTLHNAKGLEYPVVFLTGLEDGLFPLSQSFDDPPKLEEERRLFYVGITRAEEKLYLSHTEMRRRNGELLPSMQSRFLREIAGSNLEEKRTLRVTSMGRGAPGRDFGFKSGGSYPARRTHDVPSWRKVDPIAEAERSQDEPRYVKGERVKHKLFGDGSIAELSGVGREVKAVIDFDDETVGRKTIKLAYTTLERGQE
ncbi:MAG TPA: UvrD-helicase domain-containing protein [Gemmatimonadaceae bacterium]|nr:UvrD-helicase domain-containing protein [Gemmatimonadaceae bacterium]